MEPFIGLFSIVGIIYFLYKFWEQEKARPADCVGLPSQMSTYKTRSGKLIKNGSPSPPLPTPIEGTVWEGPPFGKVFVRRSGWGNLNLVLENGQHVPITTKEFNTWIKSAKQL